LLAFARKQPLRPDATDAKVIIEGMKEMLQRTLSEAIEQRFELNGQGSIMVDPQQLENAILNLAINARDATPDGGRLTFTIEDRLIETDGVVIPPKISGVHA
jgi:signal transduction histidine kinase